MELPILRTVVPVIRSPSGIISKLLPPVVVDGIGFLIMEESVSQIHECLTMGTYN
jgi:hypothetical protein